MLSYREHFLRCGYYNFPAWTGVIPLTLVRGAPVPAADVSLREAGG